MVAWETAVSRLANRWVRVDTASVRARRGSAEGGGGGADISVDMESSRSSETNVNERYNERSGQRRIEANGPVNPLQRACDQTARE